MEHLKKTTLVFKFNLITEVKNVDSPVKYLLQIFLKMTKQYDFYRKQISLKLLPELKTSVHGGLVSLNIKG